MEKLFRENKTSPLLKNPRKRLSLETMLQATGSDAPGNWIGSNNFTIVLELEVLQSQLASTLYLYYLKFVKSKSKFLKEKTVLYFGQYISTHESVLFRL